VCSWLVVRASSSAAMDLPRSKSVIVGTGSRAHAGLERLRRECRSLAGHGESLLDKACATAGIPAKLDAEALRSTAQNTDTGKTRPTLSVLL